MTTTTGRSTPERIVGLIQHARKLRASDVHVSPEFGVALRTEREIRRLDDWQIDSEEIRAFLEIAFDRLARARFDAVGHADVVYRTSGSAGAVRVHAARGQRGPRLTMRLLNLSIPTLESLALPAVLATLATLRDGLVIVVGPRRSGKSTTLAALIDELNGRRINIITIEASVEYAHCWRTAIVNQYEVGRDVATFADGVRAAMRADPDVLVIGELDGHQTMEAGLEAAEAGHLVFAALTTPLDTSQAIGRVVGLFPIDEQPGVRARLADTLAYVIALKLLPMRTGQSLCPAVEILIVSEAVRRLIREGTWHQIRPILATSRKDGAQTLERHLSELVGCGAIDSAVARTIANYPNEVVAPAGALR